MSRKHLTGLTPQAYEHPFDRQALVSLEKIPGVSLFFKKVNEYGIDRLLRFKFGAICIRVNSRNFPELYQTFLEACRTIDVDPIPELYLLHGTGFIRTLTIGANSPMIILNFDGMKELSKEELFYALGHELGHIKSKHLLYHQTAMILPGLGRVIANSTLGIGGLATNGIEFALYQWVMMAKLTSDRAALLACQDIDIAYRSLMKMAGLPEEYINPITIEEFIEQARDFGSYNLDSLDKFTKMLSFMEPNHPWTTLRAAELLKWIESGEYEALLAGNTPQPQVEVVKESKESVTSSGDWDFLESWEAN